MKIIDNIENGLFLAQSKIEGAGVGLFTSKHIPIDVPVCEYKGDVFDSPEKLFSTGRYDYTLSQKLGAKLPLYTLGHNSGKLVDCQPWATKNIIGLGGFANDAAGFRLRMASGYMEKRKEILGYTEERLITTPEERETKSKWEIEIGYNTFYWAVPNETKFYLISMRNIKPGEEIFVNYGEKYWSKYIDALTKNPNHFKEISQKNEDNR
jgi:hypothetical protein